MSLSTQKEDRRWAIAKAMEHLACFAILEMDQNQELVIDYVTPGSATFATTNLPCVQGSERELCPYSGDVDTQFSANLDSSGAVRIINLLPLPWMNADLANLLATVTGLSDWSNWAAVDSLSGGASTALSLFRRSKQAARSSQSFGARERRVRFQRAHGNGGTGRCVF